MSGWEGSTWKENFNNCKTATNFCYVAYMESGIQLIYVSGTDYFSSYCEITFHLIICITERPASRFDI